MYDPIRAWEAWDAQREARLERLPVCDCCGEPIQDDSFYRIGNFNYCPGCIKDCRVSTEDFTDEKF